MEFRVLGPLAISVTGRDLEIGPAKRRSLLALLLVSPNEVVSRDRLIEELWEGAPPEEAVATLHAYVYRLRRVITAAAAQEPTGGPVPVLRRQSAGYLLQVTPDAVDAHRFESLLAEGEYAARAGDPDLAVNTLRSGLGLWRGSAFADIPMVSVRERADQLEEQRLRAAELCLSAELELGRHDAVVVELETLVGAHPLREQLWTLLMTALYRSCRQAEALDAYHRLRRALNDDLGIDPSPPTQELHQRMLAQHPDLNPPAGRPGPALVGAHSPAAPSAADVAVPRQLPKAVGGFSGRADVLARLDSLLPERVSGAGPPATVVAALSGTGGIGKTALAVHWSHRVAAHFPDGQLYVNLRGFDPAGEPLSVEAALHRFLQAFGVPPEQIPADAEARGASYRSLLADRRVLVVLDNALDADQVRPLLPASPGCLALVTSRRQQQSLVVTDAAHPISLDVLGLEEARRVLTYRLGEPRVAREPEAVRDILHGCAGLPLALVIVSARAAVAPERRLRDLAAELHEAGCRLDALSGDDPVSDLRTVFSWSYRQLAPDAARLFGLLGLHPGPEIATTAAAALAGLPAPDTRRLLDRLAQVHLVTEQAADRHVLHDLVRTYAIELAPVDEPSGRAATARMLDHHLHTAHDAAMLLNPHREPITPPAPAADVEPVGLDDADQALDWFTAEVPVLAALVRLSCETGHDTHGWQLAWALSNFLDRQGRWDEAVQVQQSALRAARRLGARAWQARTHRELAATYTRQNRYQDAHTQLTQALELHAELGYLAEQARIHHNLGWLCAREHRYAEALHHGKLAAETYRAAGSRAGHARALNALGWYYARTGDQARALHYCEQALPLLQSTGERQGEADVWDSLGYIHHHRGDHDRAADCYHRALDLFRQLADRNNQAQTLVNLGDSQYADDDREAAAASWRQALEIFEELDYPDAADIRAKLARLSSEAG